VTDPTHAAGLRTGLRVVVTGGPGSGKTTLVEALERRGYATVPEAALQVIDELNARRGVDGQKAWRLSHRAEFQALVLARQIALEQAAGDPPVLFLDRGRLDGVAYCRFFAVPLPPGYLELARAGRYDRVLALDTLASFAERGASGRTSTREDSRAIGQALDAEYRAAGHAVTRVPELCDAEERVAFVLGALGLRPPAGP
jgi:predicted ATPase